MPIDLARPVADYIAAANGDTDARALGRCFANDAIVRDEGHVYEGLPAIEKWRTDSRAKYRATLTPLKSVEQDGKTIVNVRLTGDFPGSPVDADFRFSLTDGKITLRRSAHERRTRGMPRAGDRRH